MRRRLFTFASGVSLALCVGTSVLWARSHRANEVLRLRGRQQLYVLSALNGTAAFAVVRLPTYRTGLETGRLVFPRSSPGADPESYLSQPLRGGFQHLSFQSPQPLAHVFVFRLWIAAALTAIAPLLWIGPHLTTLWTLAQRRRRRRGGLCTACGYDLRASPDRCPECGRATGE